MSETSDVELDNASSVDGSEPAPEMGTAGGMQSTTSLLSSSASTNSFVINRDNFSDDEGSRDGTGHSSTRPPRTSNSVRARTPSTILQPPDGEPPAAAQSRPRTQKPLSSTTKDKSPPKTMDGAAPPEELPLQEEATANSPAAAEEEPKTKKTKKKKKRKAPFQRSPSTIAKLRKRKEEAKPPKYVFRANTKAFRRALRTPKIHSFGRRMTRRIRARYMAPPTVIDVDIAADEHDFDDAGRPLKILPRKLIFGGRLRVVEEYGPPPSVRFHPDKNGKRHATRRPRTARRPVLPRMSSAATRIPLFRDPKPGNAFNKYIHDIASGEQGGRVAEQQVAEASNQETGMFKYKIAGMPFFSQYEFDEEERDNSKHNSEPSARALKLPPIIEICKMNRNEAPTTLAEAHSKLELPTVSDFTLHKLAAEIEHEYAQPSLAVDILEFELTSQDSLFFDRNGRFMLQTQQQTDEFLQDNMSEDQGSLEFREMKQIRERHKKQFAYLDQITREVQGIANRKKIKSGLNAYRPQFRPTRDDGVASRNPDFNQFLIAQKQAGGFERIQETQTLKLLAQVDEIANLQVLADIFSGTRASFALSELFDTAALEKEQMVSIMSAMMQDNLASVDVVMDVMRRSVQRGQLSGADLAGFLAKLPEQDLLTVMENDMDVLLNVLMDTISSSTATEDGASSVLQAIQSGKEERIALLKKIQKALQDTSSSVTALSSKSAARRKKADAASPKSAKLIPLEQQKMGFTIMKSSMASLKPLPQKTKQPAMRFALEKKTKKKVRSRAFSGEDMNDFDDDDEFDVDMFTRGFPEIGPAMQEDAIQEEDEQEDARDNSTPQQEGLKKRNLIREAEEAQNAIFTKYIENYVADKGVTGDVMDWGEVGKLPLILRSMKHIQICISIAQRNMKMAVYRKRYLFTLCSIVIIQRTYRAYRIRSQYLKTLLEYRRDKRSAAVKENKIILRTLGFFYRGSFSNRPFIGKYATRAPILQLVRRPDLYRRNPIKYFMLACIDMNKTPLLVPHTRDDLRTIVRQWDLIAHTLEIFEERFGLESVTLDAGKIHSGKLYVAGKYTGVVAQSKTWAKSRFGPIEEEISDLEDSIRRNTIIRHRKSTIRRSIITDRRTSTLGKTQLSIVPSSEKPLSPAPGPPGTPEFTTQGTRLSIVSSPRKSATSSRPDTDGSQQGRQSATSPVEDRPRKSTTRDTPPQIADLNKGSTSTKLEDVEAFPQIRSQQAPSLAQSNHEPPQGRRRVSIINLEEGVPPFSEVARRATLHDAEKSSMPRQETIVAANASTNPTKQRSSILTGGLQERRSTQGSLPPIQMQPRGSLRRQSIINDMNGPLHDRRQTMRRASVRPDGSTDVPPPLPKTKVRQVMDVDALVIWIEKNLTGIMRQHHLKRYERMKRGLVASPALAAARTM